MPPLCQNNGHRSNITFSSLNTVSDFEQNSDGFLLLLFSSFDPFGSKWWPFSLQFFCDLFFWLDWFYHFYCITFGFLILISLWKRWYKALKFKYIKHLCLWSYTNTNRILSYIYLYDLSDSWRKLVKSVQWEQQGDYSWEK